MPPARAYDATSADRVRVGIYVRQSHKNETDSRSSPMAQERSGRAYTASQPGWECVKVFSDVGISGYDPSAYRPGYEDMMTWVREGRLDVVVVFALSRLTRQGAREALRIHGEMQDHGVGLVSTTEPFINTSHDNPFSVAFFALIAALAEQESRNKSEFIRAAFGELRERGSHSSGPVPYPFVAEPVQVDGVTIRRLRPNPDLEAYGLRMVTLAEEGMPPGRIASVLTEEGVPTPATANENLTAVAESGRTRRKGGEHDNGNAEWSATVVTRILRDPRLAGFAVTTNGKRREILRDEHGEPVAPHVGLISPARWYALQERLDGRKRERKAPKSGEMTLLGSWGLLRCGVCGSTMTVSHTEGAYVCNLRRAVGTVRRHVVRVAMAHADDIVANRLWTRIGALDPLQDEDDAAMLGEAAVRFARSNVSPEVEMERLAVAAQLSHVQGTLTQLYGDRAEGLYAGETGRRVFREQAERLTRHEEECTARLRELERAAAAGATLPYEAWMAQPGDPLGPGTQWALWSTEERRGFLALWIDRVTVAPAGDRRGWTYGENASYERAMERVDIVWAAPAAEDDADAPPPSPPSFGGHSAVDG